MKNTPWMPSIKWHAKILGLLLAGCIMAFFILKYVTGVLPTPYQPKRPAPETMPWQK